MGKRTSIVSTLLSIVGLAACSSQSQAPSPTGSGSATSDTGGAVATAGVSGTGGSTTASGGSTTTATGAGVGGDTGGVATGTGGTAGANADAALATGGSGGGTGTDAAMAGPETADSPVAPRDLLPGTGGGSGGVVGTGGTTGGSDGPAEARAPDAALPDAAPQDTLPAGDTAGSDKIVTFKNGIFWNDSSGKRIEAHGGGFYKEGDIWYWVGEDKSATPANPKAWVNLYSSKDLVTWQFRNSIVTRNTSTELAAADRVIERPKLIYNDSTKQYVLWLHYENSNYSTASAGVFQSPTIDGDYKFVKGWKPLGNMSRDCNLFKDDDGTAYFMSAANENADMMIYELTDDYLDVKQLTLKLWAGAKREAPAMFKVGGTYFMITSACTGWDPNQAQYATATNIAGPWSNLTNVGDSTTFDTQSTYVIPVMGSEVTTYIYASDRWQDPDLPSSKYIWLPLVVSGTKLAMDYYDQWSLNLTTGRWSAGNSRYLPKDKWKLVMVDSEETSAESDQGGNAFDGVRSTFWHSRYTGGVVNLPHEIQIDMGATYAITEFSYLPRQDNNLNGVVGQYELYLSTDSANWGTAVKTGTFAADATEKVVTFPSKTTRYLRFRALSEGQGKQYTAVAELSVVGTAQ
jgi:hypothetical protein